VIQIAQDIFSRWTC